MTSLGTNQATAPKTTKSRIVFPFTEEGDRQYYTMAEYNHDHSYHVITNQEVKAVLQRIQSLPIFPFKSPFSKPYLLIISALVIYGGYMLIPLWIIFFFNIGTGFLIFNLVLTLLVLLAWAELKRFARKLVEVFEKRKQGIDEELKTVNDQYKDRQIRFHQIDRHIVLDLEYMTNGKVKSTFCSFLISPEFR